MIQQLLGVGHNGERVAVDLPPRAVLLAEVARWVAVPSNVVFAGPCVVLRDSHAAFRKLGQRVDKK